MADSIVLQNQDGESQEFHPDDVAGAVASGQWGAPVGTPVPVSVNGTLTQVPIEQLTSTLKSSGGVVASPKDFADAELQRQYGDVKHQAEAAAAGAARGISLGASDVALRAIGGSKAAEEAQKVREANPLTSGLSERGGAAAGMLATGGATAPEEAAALEVSNAVRGATEGASAVRQAIAAPQRLVTGIGDAVEHGVAKLLPEEATSLAGRLATKAVTLGARGAAEGAAISGADYLSDTALSPNPKLDGEKFLSAVGHGALFGGLGGSILGAGGALGADLLDRSSPKLTRGAELLVGKHLGVEPEVARTLLDHKLIDAGDKASSVLPKVLAAQSEVDTKITQLESRLDATGAAGPKLEDLGQTFESKVGKHLEDTSPLKTLGEDIEALKPATLSINDYIKTSDGAAKLRSMISSDPSVFSKLQAGKVPAGLLPPVSGVTSFKKAYELRSKIDQALTSPEAKDVVSGLSKVRAEIDESITAARDKAAKSLGEDHEWVKSLNQATQESDHLTQAAEALTKKAASKDGGILEGFGGALIAGNLAHGNIAGAAATAAGQFARKQVKDRVPLAAAVVMDKLAAMGSIQRATARTDRQLTRGIEAAMGKDTARLASPPDHGLSTFADKREAVVKAMENPQEHFANINQTVASLAPHAPNVASAFVDAALRSTQYLYQVMPKNTPSNPMMPDVNPIVPTKHEEHVFSRVFEVVHDPPSILVDVAQGTCVPEQVEALSNTHPEMLQEIRDRQIAAMAEMTKPLPQKLLISNAILLGKATDPSLTPQAVQQSQDIFSQPAPSPEPRAHSGGKSAKTMSIAKDSALTGQRSQFS